MRRKLWTRWSVVLVFSIVLLIHIEVSAFAQSTVDSRTPQLLFFTNAGCAPCRQVEPILFQMTQLGYPITKIDTTKYPDWVNRFGIRSTPTVVLYQNNRVLNRHSGFINQQQIQGWFSSAGFRPERQQSLVESGAQQPSRTFASNQTRAVEPSPTQTYASNLSSAAGAGIGRIQRRISDPNEPTMHKGTRIPGNDVEQVAMDATVRLKVEDPEGISYATGTVIHCHEGEWLVLTCGHVFRDANGKGEITAEYGFGDGQIRTASGRLFDYNSEARDIGLVVVSAGVDVQPVTVARENFPVADSDQVFSVGCDHGKDATIRRTRIKRHARYDGVVKYDIYGRPVDGRSGGGLFTAGGQLVGVCNAASVEDDEGIYTGLNTVYWQLAKVRLKHLFEDRSRVAAISAPQPIADPTLNQWVTVQAGFQASNGTGESARSSRGNLIAPSKSRFTNTVLSSQSHAENTGHAANDLEIVMTARKRGDSNSMETITIANPPPQLLNYFHSNAVKRNVVQNESIDNLRREMPPVTWTADLNSAFRGQSPR